ncbi:MAG: TolC family protein [Verrucomicrobiota bacterium]
MPRIRYHFPILVVFLAAPLSAEDPPAWTRDQWVERALAGNPDLLVARMEIEKAEARHRGTGLLPNPEIGAEIKKDRPFPSSSRQTAVTLTFSQAFPVTDRLRLARRVSAVEIDAAKAELAEQQRHLIEEVESTIVEVLALAERWDLQSRQMALLSEWAAFAEEQYRSGELPRTDSLEARLEVGVLKQEQTAMAIQRKEWLARLRFLAGLAPDAVMGVTGDLDLDPVDAVLADVVSNCGDVEASILALLAAEGEVALARAAKWEDLKVGVSIENQRMQDDPTGRGNDWFAGLGISIPLPLWNDNRHEVAEKEAASRQAALRKQGVLRRIESEWVAAAEQAAAYRALLAGELAATRELAAENLDARERAYQAGQTSFSRVLRAREKWLGLEEGMLRVRRKMALTLVKMRTMAASHLSHETP